LPKQKQPEIRQVEGCLNLSSFLNCRRCIALWVLM